MSLCLVTRKVSWNWCLISHLKTITQSECVHTNSQTDFWGLFLLLLPARKFWLFQCIHGTAPELWGWFWDCVGCVPTTGRRPLKSERQRRTLTKLGAHHNPTLLDLVDFTQCICWIHCSQANEVSVFLGCAQCPLNATLPSTFPHPSQYLPSPLCAPSVLSQGSPQLILVSPVTSDKPFHISHLVGWTQL